jgi:hypothetical protein
MHEDFGCNDACLELKNLVENSRLVVGLISMPNEPFAFENIATRNDLDEEVEIT